MEAAADGPYESYGEIIKEVCIHASSIPLSHTIVSFGLA